MARGTLYLLHSRFEVAPLVELVFLNDRHQPLSGRIGVDCTQEVTYVGAARMHRKTRYIDFWEITIPERDFIMINLKGLLYNRE